MEEKQRNCDSCASASAQMYCVCTTPPTYLCGTCGIDHSAQGHEISPLAQDDAVWARCSLCNLAKSALLCCCALPPVQLCNTCVRSHDRSSHPPHVHVSILAKGYLTSAERVERLVIRHMGKEEARVRILANLDRITACEKEVHLECEQLVVKLRRKEAELCARLAQIRTELALLIEQSVKEAEDHLHEDDYPCSGLTASLINYHRLSPKPDLSLFSCSLSVQRLEEDIEHFAAITYDRLTMEVPVSRSAVLPVLTAKELRKFDYEHEVWLAPVTLSRPIEISSQSAWIFVDRGKWLFACGRYPSGGCAYLIDGSTGTVEQQPPMRQRRCEHGLAVFQSSVYVFGGLDSPKYLKSCEKFNLTGRSWSNLPEMQEARDCFNPCVLHAEIYLVGGRNARFPEVFNLENETFRKLKLTLPRPDMTACVLMGSCLIALQSDAAYEWDTAVDSPVLKKFRLALGEAWSNTPPVHHEGNIYLLSFVKSVKKTDLNEVTVVPVPAH